MIWDVHNLDIVKYIYKDHKIELVHTQHDTSLSQSKHGIDTNASARIGLRVRSISTGRLCQQQTIDDF